MFFDRPAPGSRALLVHLRNKVSELATAEEIEELTLSAGLEVVGLVESARREPHPKTMVGAGKTDEIRLAAIDLQADLIIFSEDLSPTQERNLEEALRLRVMGRTGLILEILLSELEPTKVSYKLNWHNLIMSHQDWSEAGLT